ncbi:uncharacterized protein YoxC [Streptococcus rupicaprae]|uniref:Uncharacterized protein YoxC n=1 Tax=Streptococcus rupicaprae TaxID=759619 RepID=A0ABV2FHI7_9STRE
MNHFQDKLQEVELALEALVAQRPSDDMADLANLLQHSGEQLPSGYDHDKILNRFQPTTKDDALYQALEQAHRQWDSYLKAVSKEVKTGRIWIDNQEGAFDQAQLSITSASSAISIDPTSFQSSLGDLADQVIELTFNYQLNTPIGSGDHLIDISLVAPGLAPKISTQKTPVSQTVQVEVPKADGSGTEFRDITVDVDTTETTQTGGSPAFAVDISMPADLSSLATEAYHKLLADYQALAGRVAQIYDTLHILSTALPDQTLTLLSDAYLDLPVDAYLTEVVTTLLSPTMAEHQANLQQLDDSILKLQTSMNSLTSQIESLSGKANDSVEAITTLLSHYETLNQKVASLQTAQADEQASQEELSTGLQALLPEFETLSNSTMSLTTSTQQNLTEAEAIRSTLTGFESNISSAESSATELSSQAEALMVAFNEELTKNQDFVGAFVKVLNNAYNEGVPNEVLLDFLSNPVKEEGQATRVTTNVYKPFTWILLIEVVSLLIAYLFSNNRIFQTTLDKFSKSSNPLLRAGSKTVIVQEMLALLLGIFIGLSSLNQLEINPIYNGLWVLTVTLIMLFLTQWQYLLLSYLRSSGMGIALFVLVTYVYLTSAIGTTATLTGLPKAMRQVNILAFFEGILSGFFVDQPISGLSLLLIMLGVLGGIAIGLFVKPKKAESATSDLPA